MQSRGQKEESQESKLSPFLLAKIKKMLNESSCKQKGSIFIFSQGSLHREQIFLLLLLYIVVYFNLFFELGVIYDSPIFQALAPALIANLLPNVFINSV